MVTFPVDDVTPAAEPLPTQPVRECHPDAMAHGGDPDRHVLEPTGVHPLLSAVSRAFADHRPLVLSPDAVWLTIAQGVAQHVRLHAEELRPLLVRHPGKKRIAVAVASVPDDADSWQHLVDTFAKELAADGVDTALFECDFSTSTDVERTAGRVVMLDAYSPYYALWMVAICGIPSITLTGAVGDWQRIRDRVEAVAGFGLEQWCRSLRPIMDQFVRAVGGDVDTAFWQRIYNPVDAYGGPFVTGWAARFYPYLSADSARWPNPLLELPIGEPRDLTPPGDHRGWYDGPHIRTEQVPATLSKAVINVNDQVNRINRVLALHAGLVGVAQDDDLALRPVAGWYLAAGAIEIDDVADRIIRDHVATPATGERPEEGAADLIGLYHRLGSASLFGGAWRLLPADEHRHVYADGIAYLMKVGELPGGRSLCGAYHGDMLHWVACRVESREDRFGGTQQWVADDLADVPIYGTSLAHLLDAALDAGGDIAHLEVGRLAALRS